MYCTRCGKENTDTSKFCVYCGAPLKQNNGSGTAQETYTNTPPSPTMPEQPTPQEQHASQREEQQQPIWHQQAEQRQPTQQQPIWHQQAEQRQTGSHEQSHYRSEQQGGMVGSAPSNTDTPVIVLKIISFICAALYLFFTLRDIGYLISGIGIIPYDAVTGIISIADNLFGILSRLLMVGAFAAFGLFRDPKQNNTETFVVTLVAAGAVRILVSLIFPLISMICSILIGPSLYWVYYVRAIVLPIVLVGISVGGVTAATLLTEKGSLKRRPFASYISELKSLPEAIRKGIEHMKNKPTGGVQGTAYGAQSSAYTGPVKMDENRSFGLYIILSWLTCGIYGWYIYYQFIRDINTMCEGDGEKTTGLLEYILLTLVTCGIYSYFWHYKFMERIQKNSARFGFNIKSFGNMDLAPCWLLFVLGGAFVSACGIGLAMMIYAYYLMFANMNLLSKAYNEKVFG